MSADPNDIQPWYSSGSQPDDPTQLDLNSLITNANASGAGTDTANTGFDAHLYTDPALAGINGANVPSVDTNGATADNGPSVLSSLSKWATDNPTLAKILGYGALSGISNAQNQKYQMELLDKQNQYKVDSATAERAREDALWKRRNDSITGTTTPNLGIIGAQMIDPSIYARK